MLLRAFPDLEFKPEFTITKGDKVVNYLSITGTHKGEFMGIAPIVKQVNVKAIDIIR